jgi:hypothetical protein
MRFKAKLTNRADGQAERGGQLNPEQSREQDPEQDAELAQALGDFRVSLHAWSAAAYSGPRVMGVARKRVWRQAAGWALGCALVAGGVSAGGVYEHRQREMKIAAAQATAEHERQAAAQRAQLAREEEEDLLAKVDSEVSREVPSAMEPLAQLMAEDETR